MSTYFDLGHATVTVTDHGQNCWHGTIRTADNITTGEFPYGTIEELRDGAQEYKAIRSFKGSIAFEPVINILDTIIGSNPC